MAYTRLTPEEKAAREAEREAERAARREAWQKEREADFERRKAARAAKKAENKRKASLLAKLPEKPAPDAVPDVVPDAAPPAPALPARKVETAEVVQELRAECEDAAKTSAKKKIERFYEDCLDSPDLNVRDKLLAAQGWSKLLGLEKQEVNVTVSPVESWVRDMRQQMSAAPMPWTREGKEREKKLLEGGK